MSDDLRPAFRRTASSPWVITAADGHRPVGFTAISVVSVSADPPLLSFNLGRTSGSAAPVLATRQIALHLLDADSEHLAHRFAGDRQRRFTADGTWEWAPDGLPALTTHLVRIRAEVTQVHDAGDSHPIVARVEHVVHGDGDPLVHHNGSYAALAPFDRYLLQGA